MRRVRFITIPLAGLLALTLGFTLLVAGVWLGYADEAAVSAVADDASPAPPRVGQTPPDFELTSLDGGPIRLHALTGRPVILYFWASWCGFCLSELPRLEQAHQSHGDDGLAVLGINIMEQRETLQAFRDETELTFPFLLDEEASVARLYEVRATPTFFFIDRDGTLRSRIIGQARPTIFDALLRAILDSKPPDQGPEAGES